MTGIICAMDLELEGFLRQLDESIEEQIAGYSFFRGTLRKRDVVLVRCGVGKVNAAVCTQTMILTYHPDLILNSGVAGSLSAGVNLCDLVIAEDLVQHDVDNTALGDPRGFVSTVNTIFFPCDSDTVRVLADSAAGLGYPAKRGRIATGDVFVSEPSVKERIRESFHADACDEEGAAIAQVCGIAGIPAAVLRCISDSTDGLHSMEYAEFAPIAANRCVDVLTEAIPFL